MKPESAYEAVRVCWRAYLELRQGLCDVVQLFQSRNPRLCKEAEADQVESWCADASQAAESARVALKPMLRTIYDANCDREPAEAKKQVGSSHAELCIVLTEDLIRLVPSREVLLDSTRDPTERIGILVGGFRVDIAHVEPGLELEAGRVRAYVRRGERTGPDSLEGGAWPWHWDRGRVVLDGELKNLRGQKRTLMRYLIRNVNRALEYQDLAEDVWGQEIVTAGAIQQGVSELRGFLRDHRHEDLAEAIESLGGGEGYMFRLE